VSKTDYVRDLTGEYSYTSKNNQWDGWLLLHHAIQPNVKKQNNFVEAGIWFHNERWQVLEYVDFVGTNYKTGMEFYPRLENYDALRDTTLTIGYKQNATILGYKYVPKNSSRLAQSDLQIYSQFVWNPDNSFNDRLLDIKNTFMFKNTSELSFRLDNEDSRLPVYTSFTDYSPLPPSQYVFTNGTVAYNTDKRKNLVFTGRLTAGGFYNGKQLGMSAGFTYRLTPLGIFGLRFDRYDLQLPNPYKNSLLYLINGKTELSFTKNLIWTTFLQYNTQANNFNINSRLQWRYKPMSDLFIVFTDNHGTLPFVKKNRALVLKMNYWFNL
jgi:hypothetical protein